MRQGKVWKRTHGIFALPESQLGQGQSGWPISAKEIVTRLTNNHQPPKKEQKAMKTETKVTLAALCEQPNIPSSLIRAVVRQMGGWESFTQSAPDITSHGIDGGFHGFIYNRDTEAFAKRNRVDIQKMAQSQAEEFGTSVTEMIQNFGCFRHGTKPTDSEIGLALYAGKEAEDSVPVLNALAWYAGEEVSREYCRMTGQD